MCVCVCVFGNNNNYHFYDEAMLMTYNIANKYLKKITYPRERGSMGGAPYVRLKLGGGQTFVTSPSKFTAKERPGNNALSQAKIMPE